MGMQYLFIILISDQYVSNKYSERLDSFIFLLHPYFVCIIIVSNLITVLSHAIICMYVTIFMIDKKDPIILIHFIILLVIIVLLFVLHCIYLL